MHPPDHSLKFVTVKTSTRVGVSQSRISENDPGDTQMDLRSTHLSRKGRPEWGGGSDPPIEPKWPRKWLRVNGHGKWPLKKEMATEKATENGYGKNYNKIWKWLRVHLDPRTESCDGSFGLDAQHSGIQH